MEKHREEIKIVMAGNWSRLPLLHKTGAVCVMLQLFLCSLSEPEHGSGPADRLPSLPATAYNSGRLNDCINSVQITYNTIFIPLYDSRHHGIVHLKARGNSLDLFSLRLIYFSQYISKEVCLKLIMKG